MNDAPQQTTEPVVQPAAGKPPAPQPQEPVPQTAPAPQPEPPVPAPRSGPPKKVLIGGVALLILMCCLAALYALSANRAPQNEAPEPTPPILPTATPIRALSSVASTSSFMKFEGDVASLSGQVNGFTVQDSRLTAPVVEFDMELTDR